MSFKHIARAVLPMALASTALLAAMAAPAAQAGFGVTEKNFEAGTCKVSSCTYEGVEAEPAEAFTQAAGHPPWGITGLELNHTGSGGSRVPEGELKRLRVDVPPGLAADPQALPECSMTEFEANSCPADTKVGKTELEAHVLLTVINIPGTVYNLQKRPGLPLLFGINTGLEPLVDVHIFLEGHVSDAHEEVLAARGVPSGDYHEYFEIDNVPKEGEILGAKVPIAVVKSKLLFEGRAGQGNFLTLPSICSGTTTSYLEVESYSGEVSSTATHPPVGIEGCDKVPFAPTAEVTAKTSASDRPDGVTTLVKVSQKVHEEEINTADIKDAHVSFPEGMTLNPSAAHGLEACTPTQIAIGSAGPAHCPAGSKIGTVTIETDLPPGTLTGSAYLGNPGGGPITGPPFTIYLDAESVYGVSVKLQGLVEANRSTGRLEASFKDNPQLPFSELALTLNDGARAPLANPLICGNAPVEALFTPYTGQAQALSSKPFTTTGCSSPLPFALTQSTHGSNANAGAYTSYTFNLNREDGQQYLSRLTTVLPAGLLGAIPSVPLCGEPQAQEGRCPASSKIGEAKVNVGAGAEPYEFAGQVYLTGPYNGAPYGLSIPVPAAAGPFDLGSGACDCVVTRVAIGVDQYTGRAIATSALPTIVKGVPLRLRSLSVAVTRPNFLFNPTNCGPLSTDSALTSTFNGLQNISSPFQVTGCGGLAFKPSLKATTSAKTSKLTGASLRVDLTQPGHEANIKSVFAQLPPQLPARLTTLQKACPAATFAISPTACRPLGAEVGNATVVTPVLPSPLKGSAYLVSHGGAAFPDLDLVLEGDNLRVIVVGNTDIKKGITTSTFAAVPDVPVSSFDLNLPLGRNSALSANGNLCAVKLFMPTIITAQNGAQIKQNTRISAPGCGVKILSRRVRGGRLFVRIRTLSAGRVSLGGKHLKTVRRRLRKASTFTLETSLSAAGRRALGRRRELSVRARVVFTPAQRGAPGSTATTAARLR